MAIAEKSRPATTATATSAIDAMEALAHRVAWLRDRARLEATATELAEAAVTGDLVCWRPCKVREPDRVLTFQPGDRLPTIDPNSSLLLPDQHLVTTRARWVAKMDHRTLSNYWNDERRTEVQAALRQARADISHAAAEVERLTAELAEARKALTTAQKRLKAAEADVTAYVAAAPVV